MTNLMVAVLLVWIASLFAAHYLGWKAGYTDAERQLVRHVKEMLRRVVSEIKRK